MPEILFAKSSQSGNYWHIFWSKFHIRNFSANKFWKRWQTQTEVCQTIVDKLGAFLSGSRANALEKTDLYFVYPEFLNSDL